jgi:hypothetical protein
MGLGIDIAHGYATLGTIGFEGRFSSAPEGSMDRLVALRESGTAHRYRNGIAIGIVYVAIAVVIGALSQPARSRTQFNCVMKKLIITDKEIKVEELLSFWIDEKARTVTLSDGRELRIDRFDNSWINAQTDDVQYEFIAAMVRSLTPDRRLRVTLQRRLLVQVIARMPR